MGLTEEPQRFAGHDSISCCCPTSHQFLNILGCFDPRAMAPGSTAFCHHMAEASMLAYTDTIRWYGDPDFEDAPIAELCSPAFAQRRADAINPERAMARPVPPVHPREIGINGGAVPETDTVAPWPPKLAGTTQIATADSDGNMAAVWISLSDAHGSLVYCPGTGVVLNSSMQNFDPRPGMQNSAKPGKMPILAAPVLVAMGHGIWEQRDHPGLNAFGRVCAVSRETNGSMLHGASFPGWRGDAMAI